MVADIELPQQVEALFRHAWRTSTTSVPRYLKASNYSSSWRWTLRAWNRAVGVFSSGPTVQLLSFEILGAESFPWMDERGCWPSSGRETEHVCLWDGPSALLSAYFRGAPVQRCQYKCQYNNNVDHQINQPWVPKTRSGTLLIDYFFNDWTSKKLRHNKYSVWHIVPPSGGHGKQKRSWEFDPPTNMVWVP